MADYTVGDYMGQEGAEYWTRLILERIKKVTYDFDDTPKPYSSNPVTSSGIYEFVMSLVSGIVGIDVQVSNTIPVDPPAHPENTIYIVMVKGDGTQGDLYTEYIWVNRDHIWEPLGTASVDLSDYAKKSDIGSATISLSLGGVQVGTFNANAKTNKTIDFPAPSNSEITVKQGDVVLGTFRLNQSEDKTVTIPEGGKPNNAAITIKRGEDEIASFTLNQSTDETIVIPKPNNSTITIKSGGVLVDTFTLDQEENKVINIPSGGSGGGDGTWIDGDAVVHNKATRTEVDERPISNGTLNYTTDTHDLFLDVAGNRIKISDWIVVSTDAERLNLSNPIEDKLYMVEETHALWSYKNGWWSLLSYGDIQTRNILLSTFPVALGSNCVVTDAQAENWSAIATMIQVSERIYLTDALQFRFIISQASSGSQPRFAPAIYKYTGIDGESGSQMCRLVCAGNYAEITKTGWYVCNFSSMTQMFLDPSEVYYFVFLHNSNGCGMPGSWCTQMNDPPYVSFLASNLGNLTSPPDTLRMESETTLRLYGSFYANALGTK